jgi:hypothetical protein
MLEIHCPTCGAAMQIPASVLGKRGTCKKCQTPFVAQATQVSPLPTPLPPPLPLPGKDIPTVVARRSGPPPKAKRPLHIGWILGSLAALLIPILTASALSFFKPLGGKRDQSITYAGIEIGSNGPRYVLVEFLPVTKGGTNFRFLSNQQTAARLTDGMEKTGTFNEQELRKTVLSVKAFYDRLVKEHAIPPERIAIVSSVGLFGPITSRKDLDQKEKARLTGQCRKTLAAEVKKATGQTMEFANLRQVAEYQLKSVVRHSDLHDAVFLDVGGGGTRGGYSDAAGLIHEIQGPGIRQFMGLVKDGLEDGVFADRAMAISEKHLREPFRNGLGKDPEFSVRGKIYLAGGITWVMTNCQHPEEADDYVRLSAGDIEAFAGRVRKTPDLLSKIQPSESLPEDRRNSLKKEYSRMRSAFKTPENLIAGADILQALSTELKFSGRDVWFYRYSDFAWLASYIDEIRRTRN